MDARKLFEDLQAVLEKSVKEVEELREIKSKISDIAAQGENIIVLNVGGAMFTTSTKTLTSIPDSLLATMLTQVVPITRQSDGSIFIDRNPRLFPYILDFYRKKEAVNVSGLSANDLYDLLDDAKYFAISGLVDLINTKNPSIEQPPAAEPEPVEEQAPIPPPQYGAYNQQFYPPQNNNALYGAAPTSSTSRTSPSMASIYNNRTQGRSAAAAAAAIPPPPASKTSGVYVPPPVTQPPPSYQSPYYKQPQQPSSSGSSSSYYYSQPLPQQQQQQPPAWSYYSSSASTQQPQQSAYPTFNEPNVPNAPSAPSAPPAADNGRASIQRKLIWECSTEPLVSIQGNTVLPTPQGVSALVCSPLKTFSSGSHNFNIEINYTKGKGSIGFMTKNLWDKIKTKFTKMDVNARLNKMNAFTHIGEENEEWGIQQESYFYTAGTRFDTCQPGWSEGSNIKYSIRIDNDLGMLDFTRDGSHWTQTIPRSEPIIFVVLAAPGVSYSISN